MGKLIKIHIILSLYNINNNKRRSEIKKCFKSILNNKNFTSITVINQKSNINIPILNTINCINTTSRPLFSDLFDYTRDGYINVITNSDILFDNTIDKIRHINDKTIFSLTRREIDGKLYRQNIGNSQDVWVVKNSVPNYIIDQLKFPIGIPGCDSKINWIFQSNGYYVANPSKSIRLYHLHSSEVRSYSNEDRIYGMHLYVKPIRISTMIAFQLINIIARLFRYNNVYIYIKMTSDLFPKNSNHIK